MARVRRAAEDGYMRNYGLAHFQREAKKKPPLYYYVMTHIWLTSLRKSKRESKESEASVAETVQSFKNWVGKTYIFD